MAAHDRVTPLLLVLLASCSTQDPSPPPWGTLQVTPSSATLTLVAFPMVGLSAAAKDTAGNVMTGRSVTWRSSNSAIVSVDSLGVVRAVGVGTANVTATSEAVSALAGITVVPDTAAELAGTWGFELHVYFQGFCRGNKTININQRPSDVAFTSVESLPGCSNRAIIISGGIAGGVAANGRISFRAGRCQYEGTIFHTPVDSVAGSVSCSVSLAPITPPVRVSGGWSAVKQSP